ncbi:CBS domain-containing protein [Evansella sp. LMS18]|uniref:CBS domain-containing protein n=1 Tax=Evansella sp. LMS18 TaxID=2924033 RepID=UPI0020D07D15|nr:CBS domain-containing protein [Evansella sp. LMS18]UTR12574.1 CBS domain-containing protein [Evansella sp. LMS18]
MSQMIRDLMSTNVVSVSPQQSIQEAAALMDQNDIGSIPVVENGQVRGILTDRDITLRATARGLAAHSPVSQCMSEALKVADANMDIHEAARIMGENQIRRLPVVENGQLVGMLAIGDLARQNIYQDEAEEALSNISVPNADGRDLY